MFSEGKSVFGNTGNIKDYMGLNKKLSFEECVARKILFGKADLLPRTKASLNIVHIIMLWDP